MSNQWKDELTVIKFWRKDDRIVLQCFPTNNPNNVFDLDCTHEEIKKWGFESQDAFINFVKHDLDGREIH